MNEAILRHLARTEALLEVILGCQAKLYAAPLKMTDEQAEKHFFGVAQERTDVIFKNLVKELQK